MTGPNQDIFVAMDDADFSRMAIIHSLRGVQDSINSMRKAMDENQTETRHVREALIEIEAHLKAQDLVQMKRDIEMLKADKERRSGERSTLDALSKSPLTYLIAAGAALIAWLKGGL
jgi:DNA-binding transcriptional MerR regulator